MWDDYETVTKPRRKRAVLRLMDESGLALPPKIIHINLERRGATFSLNTVRRHIKEMEEEGFVRKIEQGRGVYEITDDGREWLYSG